MNPIAVGGLIVAVALVLIPAIATLAVLLVLVGEEPHVHGSDPADPFCRRCQPHNGWL